MIHTSLCDLLEITHPIVQAGMGGVAGSRLAAAVSEAGGMGTIGAYRMSPIELQTAIREAYELSKKPIGVNFVPEVLSTTELEQGVITALKEGVRVFCFFSLIPHSLINELHQHNALVLIQVGSVEQAEIAIRSNVDAIIVQGWEAGGHLRGHTALLPLLSAVCHRWSNIPVLAAGGITTGRMLVAALAVGAVGVWMGTCFVAADEANAHPDYQQRLLTATAEDTIVTHVFQLGWPGTKHRVIKNQFTDSEGSLPPEIIGFTQVMERKIPLFLGSVAVPTKLTSGTINMMAQYCGQGCQLVDSIKPAAHIIHDVITEAEKAIHALSKFTCI